MKNLIITDLIAAASVAFAAPSHHRGPSVPPGLVGKIGIKTDSKPCPNYGLPAVK